MPRTKPLVKSSVLGMSASGEKRPAVGSEDDLVARSQSQRPRLEASVLASDEAAKVSEAGQVPVVDTRISSDAATVIDIDLICNIASCMHPGDDLMNLCVSAGPVDAAKVRTQYLRDNEQYVVASLKKLGDIKNLASHWYIFRDNLHLFDKCRNNISAWMRVNTSWQTRCTDENMKRYQEAPLRIDANLVFNNPAVAIEVGLLEVFRFHIEEKGVDVNRALWDGFTEDDEDNFLIRLALVRDDIDILEYLLSVDGFDFTRMIDFTRMSEEGSNEGLECDIIDFAHQYSKEKCFKAFIRHPKVNVNAVDSDGDTPLCIALDELRWSTRNVRTIGESECSRLVGRILFLLEAGANPHSSDSLSDMSLIEYARFVLRRDTENQHWREIVEKMEEMIDDSPERD